MKKSLFKLKSKRKQHGIALIFALAMLSLLLIMAIGFATSAIFEQKAASNSASSTNARILAQSTLNRVLTLLGVYGSNVQYSYDKNNPTTPTNNNDMLSHLSTFVSGAPLYTWQDTDLVGWEYFKVNDGTDNRLIGRFAYQVIPVAGLDPGALVAPGVDESLDAEPRPGNTVDEINLMSVSTADIPATLAKKLSYTAIGQYPGPATGWQSFKNLFTLTGIADTTLQTKFLKWFMLDTSRLKAKEAYRLDKSDPAYYHRFNLNRDWNTDFPPAVYPPVAIYEKILLDKNPASPGIPDGVPDQMPATYTVSTTNAGYGIPWLAFFGYDKTGALDVSQGATFGATAAGVIARRRQIAANLVDYCRPDDTAVSPAVPPPLIAPTSDVDPAAWYNSGTSTWGTIPTFTGNKRTPYINELGFHVMVELAQTAVNGTNTKGKGKGKGKGNKNTTSKNIISLAVDVDAVAELVDIYGVTLPAADSTVTVDYTFSYNVTGAAAPAGTLTSSGTVTIPVAKSDWGAGSHYAAPAAWASLVFPAAVSDPIYIASITAGTAPNISVNNITFKINKAVLSYNGKNYDYAYINTPSAPLTVAIAMATDTTDTIDKDYFISFQANDPRQNLNAGDWTVTKTAVMTDGTLDVAQYNTLTGGGTLESMNNNFGTSTAGLDPEVADPALASTAYIRQGPMKSPWEIGLIHRGKAWETINFKAYDPTKATTFVNTGSGIIPGGTAYIAGDANILDQVKMDSNTTNYKVNINAVTDPATTQNVALQALLRNIPIGSTWADPGNGGGTKITAPATTLVPKIAAMTYQTRAAVATLAALYDGSCGVIQGTHDAQAEELIGKFINLTDVSGRYFYIIVLAQAIKDIGGPGGSGIDIIKKSTDGTKVFKFTAANGGLAAKLGTFDYDPVTGLYADEIVGEQKIKVLISLEPPLNTPRIISYEFIE